MLVSDDPKEPMHWMADHLRAQGLIGDFFRMEYWGEVPKLRSLAEIDFSAFDEEFVVNLMDDLDDEEVDYSTMEPSDVPYLEYINAFLRGRGIRLVDLVPFEYVHILCVYDDPEKLAQLSQCLKNFEADINMRDPLDEEQVKARFKQFME
jgi:hypothetical protein